MNQLAFIACAATFASFALLGCSSGGDIYVDSSNTGTSKSSLSCHVEPGEDVCARTFDDVSSSTRPAIVSLLQSAADFAGVARDGRDELEHACQNLVAQLGAAPPTYPNGATANVHAKVTCDAAVAAIATVRQDAFTITVTTPACTNKPAPSCVINGEPRSSCAGASVRLTLKDGATARDQAAGKALQENLAFAASTKTRLEMLAPISRALTGQELSDSVQGGGAGGDACLATARALALTGSEDVTAMTTLSSSLLGAIHVGL